MQQKIAGKVLKIRENIRSVFSSVGFSGSDILLPADVGAQLSMTGEIRATGNRFVPDEGQIYRALENISAVKCSRAAIMKSVKEGRYHIMCGEIDRFVAIVSSVLELMDAGASKFIIDLRNNPGGDRDAIISVLDYILPEGPLFRLKQSDGSVQITDWSDKNCIDNEFVVLVNGSTASAAELFTAAMRDYDRAKIIGTTTYGKGSMQTFYRLSDGSVFKTTSDLYYPPYSDNYDGVGIEPDYTVELDEALTGMNPYKIPDADDNQLAAAYDVLTGKK